MKTTALFALIVALLARQPAVRGPGQEEPGAARPTAQQAAPIIAPKPAKPEEEAAKESQPKHGPKESGSARKD